MPHEPRIVSVGLDGRSQPMYRYSDDMALPDHMRRIVDPQDRPDYAAPDVDDVDRHMRHCDLLPGHAAHECPDDGDGGYGAGGIRPGVSAL